MKKIILASHGSLADGMKDTLKMIAGEPIPIFAFSMTENKTVETISMGVSKIIESSNPEDKIYIFSDLAGGSVNTVLVNFLSNPNVDLIAGMNVPLILNFMLSQGNNDLSLLDESICIGQEAIKKITIGSYDEEDIWGDE